MLIDLLREIIPMANLKCCVSSRPERPFDRFYGSPMLKLQDLTRDDVRAFVSSSISQHTQNKQLSDLISGLIVQKANGVFLWAKLVVKDQTRGLRNNDDVNILRMRLEALPSQIEELYSDMLSRVDAVYHSQAADYIQLAGTWSTGSVFNCSILQNAFDDQMHLRNPRTDPQTIVDACSSIKERIELLCGGFLGLQYNSGGRFAGDDSVLDRLAWKPRKSRFLDPTCDWSKAYVRFSHRTAKNFFDTDEVGIKFMQANLTSKNSPTNYSTAICLARMSMCQHEQPRKYMFEFIRRILTEAHDLDDYQAGQNSVKSLDYVNRTITSMDRKFNAARSSHFWFSRWGPDSTDSCYKRNLPISERHSVWPDDGSSPIWSPMSFIGVAVLFRLHRYASIKLQ